jgi:putative endonuclease
VGAQNPPSAEDSSLMVSVYIIYSPRLDKYYVGQSEDVISRLEQHNKHLFSTGYTVISDEWEIFHQIDCENRTQAVRIEKHIKRMKSRKYIESLKKYPGIVNKLLESYQ